MTRIGRTVRLAGPARSGGGVAIPFNPPEWGGSPERIFEFWKLTKGARVAVCALWNHPLGAEVRCDVDGEMWRTKASRDLGQLLDASDEWRKAFELKGWTA
jgi:hypothetical protein